jgi:hypothetical protein
MNPSSCPWAFTWCKNGVWLFIFYLFPVIPNGYLPGIMGKKKWPPAFTKVPGGGLSAFVKPSSHNMLCKSISRYTTKIWPGFYVNLEDN